MIRINQSSILRCLPVGQHATSNPIQNLSTPAHPRCPSHSHSTNGMANCQHPHNYGTYSSSLATTFKSVHSQILAHHCCQKQFAFGTKDIYSSSRSRSTMATSTSGKASTHTEPDDVGQSEEFDEDPNDIAAGYDDFALGSSSAAGATAAKCSKGSKSKTKAEKTGPYSAKHTRLRESRNSGK